MARGVSLREVLHLPSLEHARVIAGAAGLDRLVRRVNVMEVPDILAWVEADELLLTTAYPLREDPAALASLVPQLADRGLAGLAVKPARYIETIPETVLHVADARAFPVIELPPESSFNEILTSVLTIILNRQAAHLQRSAEIHDRFTSIVLGGGGLPQIAEALAEAVGRPVALVDAGSAFLTGTPGTDVLGRPGTVLPLDALARTGAADHPAAASLDGRPVIVQAIKVGGERFGAVVVLGGDEPLADEDVDAIEYAATIAALRQVHARAVAEADQRFQAVCLEELITGHVDRAVLTERAQAFKWDLSAPRAALVAQLEELDGLPFSQLIGTPAESPAQRRLADVLRAALGRTAIVWERSSEAAALVVVPADGGTVDLRDAGERVLAEAARSFAGARVSVGIGRPRPDPVALAGSFAEARRAVEIGRRIRGPGRVSRFDELGVDRLLAGVPEAELGDFARTQLGPLLEHDARHGTDLVATLEVFLETRNGALAARRLFVHYNTLKNRLRSIEDVIGPFATEPERCLDLALALRIWRLSRG